jgi:hypothetical protein
VEQRDDLAMALLGSVNSLCTDAHGCRVVGGMCLVSNYRRS